MLFDLSNYWIFLLFLSAVYVAASTFIQMNVGGKGRFKGIQEEMKALQKRMMEASRQKDNKGMDELFSQNWKLTMEMMKLQFIMLGGLLVVLVALMAFFPLVEPGIEDDVRMPLFDDGLAAHCDIAAGDGTFSNCYAIPQGAQKGAWVVDAHLYSPSNESLAKNATAIYVEGGQPSDIWLQPQAQGGILDGLMGKVPHTLSVATDRQNYSLGETVAIRSSYSPQSPSAGAQGERLEAAINSGTFFHVDLPFALPLINISRIIGSYGVFLLFAFFISIAYSIGKAVYSAISKKKQ